MIVLKMKLIFEFNKFNKKETYVTNDEFANVV